MQSLAALVLGTAGHIDHGKTSLIRALTGTDTDRLKEEKRRGISIDIGIAQMRLPDGRVVSFIDVPGHENFVRNMLAGAAGMEAVLLIVAANDSVMPQTREHFEICRLLGMRRGLIVLTKVDVASAEERERCEREVRGLVEGSFLAEAPMAAVSTLTGAGLGELKRQLAILAAEETLRDGTGIARLPIDRSFAIKGFGAVATGTLYSGAMQVGDGLELLPSKERVRVRNLQTQHASVKAVKAGQRVAVNLAGVEQRAMGRGDSAVTPGLLACTRVIDIELHWLLRDAPPRPREEFVLHIGTAEVSAHIGLHRSGIEFPRFARLRLAKEVLALPGDRLVLRRPTPSQTVGGGIVIDAFPPRRVNRAHTIARLESLSWFDLGRRVELFLDERADGLRISDLIRITGATHGKLLSAIQRNPGIVLTGQRAVTSRWVDGKRRALLKWLREQHAAHPNAGGASLASARLGLDPELAALVLKDFAEIRIEGDMVALAGHRAAFAPGEAAALQKLEHVFRAAGLAPPALAGALADAGVDAKKARALLEHLVKARRLIRLPQDLIFHVDAIAHIRSSLAQHKGRRFSVPEFKEWTGISRKFAIPLLEYLDQQRITRREGDMRLIL